jgi:RNA polymerase sigma factor (sigma-70 family)
MPQPVSEFHDAINRVCSGSEDAVWDFIEEYGPHIQRVVRNRLHQSLRAKFDSIDFVQMVWASLFADLRRIADFRSAEELISYLVGMARNKVIEECRRRTKFERYNVYREQSLTESDLSDARTIQRHDTPSQQMIAKERLQKLMGSSPRDQAIIRMKLTGATYVEIAKAMGMNERTVRQIVVDMEHALARS